MKAIIHARLARFGVSGPGRDWLLRALHPASEERSPGLPDQSSQAVLRPDFRQEATIQAPPGVGGSSTWDCFIWTPNGDVNALYWAAAPQTSGSVDFASSSPPAGAVTGVVTLQNAGIQTTTGVVTYETFGGAATNAITQYPGLNPVSFRHQFKSVTITQIASAVSDQGQVYAAQFAPCIRRVGDVIPDGYDSGIPDPANPPNNLKFYAGWYQSVLPAYEGDLCAMAPDFYEAASRDGVYMPLRLSGPAQPFARTVAGLAATAPFGRATYAQTDPTGSPCGAILTPNNGQPLSSVGTTNVPWVFLTPTVVGNAGAALPNGRYQFDSGYDNMNMGVIIFRGLSGTGGGGGGFGAALQLKVIAGLEIAPNPSTGSRVFTEAPAPYEPRALEAYYAICLELKGAYPSSYNSLESILDAIGGAASKVWGYVEPMVREVTTRVAPALVDAGTRVITRAAEGFGGARGMRQQSRSTRPSRGIAAPKGRARVTYRAPSVARSSSKGSRRPLRSSSLKKRR